ncbi:serine threonine-protein kinase ctr1 [Chrysochromulina tobinii]|uniref:Serine threonine-protein kinase ctr1 n=1 Tax=Chrysochromulina tobinii TaxID=1460289 RepID=A0A0M0LP65_9EUKA|nr:serine threonine-protein kinase ctr1 [Chrysochromulina tobinii]|eukprot:KOO52801.1 serine threonine-protein kinase ctr1 [Chrysochromulina sp. CCMP291]
MVGGFQRSLKGEDCFATRQDIICGDSITCILVADGHGGSHVSTYISSRVLQQICASAADGSAAALNVACNAVFKKVHEEVCSSKFDTGERKAGSTLTVICVNATRGEVSCWNVGDSMALLVENDGYIELGVSHRLEENQQEQLRVVAKGATLGRAIDPNGQPGGPIRAFPGGLAVTRGIGDADCAAFVLPEPSFVTRKVPPMGGALVACSDGVWDHLSAQEAAAVLISGDYSDGKSAAAKVVKTAISKRGLTDDTTACVILFGPTLDDGSKEGNLPKRVKDGFESEGGRSFLRRVKSSEVEENEDEDSDSSKEHRSGDMDGSKMDGSKTLEDDEAVVPWAVSQSMKKRPMRNADPTRGWHSVLDVDDGHGNPVSNAVEGGFKSIRDEESDLRGVQLMVKGKLPEQVRAVEWTSLGEMKYLGEGEFATAHRTTLDGEKVAIKMLKPAKQNSIGALRGIKREIMLMTLMDHPNVLNAYALGQLEGKPFVIIELLATVLNKELPRDPDTIPFWVRWREVKAWPLMRCLNCGLQLSRALQYCHDDAFPGYRILHRDVKPNNIGFLATGELVLFDFGLASLWRHGEAFDDIPRKLTGECGSMRYMAPEVANSQNYNHKAEVYSFASVLWEICSHRKPFLEFSSPELFKKAA